jgi:hypothetical protein
VEQKMPASNRVFAKTRVALAAIILTCFAPFSPGENSPALTQATRSSSELWAGGQFTYIVRRGDSLTSIGARFAVDIHVLAAANGLSSGSRLRESQSMFIDTLTWLHRLLSAEPSLNKIFHFADVGGECVPGLLNSGSQFAIELMQFF